LSCVAIDTLTDATQLSPTIGNANDPVEQRTANQHEVGQSSWVKLSCVGVAIDTSPTQLNSTRRRVELCRYKRAFRIRRSEHITPALISLHWLRVPERISIKLAVLTYRSIHGTSPSYIQSCFARVADMTSRRRLRSSASHRLEVPPVRLCIQSANGRSQLPAPTCGTTFRYTYITSVQSLAVFRQRLKTFLFSRFYPGILIWLIYHYWLLSLFFFILFLLAFPVNLAIIDII